MPLVPWEHQEKHYKEIADILRKHLIAYIAWEERTGKTLTAILVVEDVKVFSVLVITKKGKPMSGWLKTIKEFEPTKRIDVVNYHQAHKKDPDHYDCIILDEAHNYISGYPKKSTMWSVIRNLTKNKPVLYISATPYAQGVQLLYHQFALSNWSPWKHYGNFYEWFRTYGIKCQIKVHGKWVEQYKKYKDKLVLDTCSHLFHTKTRKELGFKYEPKNQIHYIELSKETKEFYNKFLKDKVVTVGNSTILADSVMKLRASLHMIEGGGIKAVAYTSKCQANNFESACLIERERIAGASICHIHYILPNDEKIQYILQNWGDSDDVVIMYNYKFEKYKLEKYFKKAEILQATTNAEGVELSHKRHLIIYSEDFSTARHTQRRARQASKLRTEEITIHYLLVKKAISEECYKTVHINKTNYVDSLFERNEI